MSQVVTTDLGEPGDTADGCEGTANGEMRDPDEADRRVRRVALPLLAGRRLPPSTHRFLSACLDRSSGSPSVRPGRSSRPDVESFEAGRNEVGRDFRRAGCRAVCFWVEVTNASRVGRVENPGRAGLARSFMRPLGVIVWQDLRVTQRRNASIEYSTSGNARSRRRSPLRCTLSCS
jgi:hypothetical protein